MDAELLDDIENLLAEAEMKFKLARKIAIDFLNNPPPKKVAAKIVESITLRVGQIEYVLGGVIDKQFD